MAVALGAGAEKRHFRRKPVTIRAFGRKAAGFVAAGCGMEGVVVP